MSLARAFTTRRAKVFGGGDGEGKPVRSHTVKTSLSGPIRSKISGPVELIHTTNMLSYNAPDIQKEPKTATSTTSSSSLRSDGSSDHFGTGASGASSPLTSPDSPFPHDDKDAKPSSAAEPNHLSCYFTLPSQSSVPTPKRSPSHTKRSYEPLARKPSVSRLAESKSHEPLGRKPSVSRLSEQSSRTVSSKASFSFSRASSTSTSTTASSHHSMGGHQGPKTSHMIPPPVPAALSTSGPGQLHKEPAAAKEPSHPFGQELAQVTELAEEYASAAAQKKRRPTATKEEQELADLGLKKFSPEDYISEIQGLFATFFSETRHARAPAPQWI